MTVADTIIRQIGQGVLMSLGAHGLANVLNDGEIEGLTFNARILQVVITHNALDYYDARVIYASGQEIVTHYETANIDAERLPRIMLALDFDGETALNPRVL